MSVLTPGKIRLESAMQLLFVYLGVCRVHYLLRVTSPDSTTYGAKIFDPMMESALRRVTTGGRYSGSCGVSGELGACRELRKPNTRHRAHISHRASLSCIFGPPPPPVIGLVPSLANGRPPTLTAAEISSARCESSSIALLLDVVGILDHGLLVET